MLSVPTLAVFAATPLLTATGSGDGNNVTVTVSGAEPRAPVVLYFNSSVYGTLQSSTLGYTNDSGYFSSTVNTSSLAVGTSTPVYVMVNGYQSGTVSWPYNSTSTQSTSGIYFSQASPSLAVGGNATLTIYGGSGGYYVSSNSNTGAVSTSVSGNTLTVSGTSGGQATITVCATNGGCGTLTTTVGGGSTGSPTLSQSGLTFIQGGQGSVLISGGTSPYTISIPNGSGISTTLVGSTLYVNSGAVGMNTINICSASGPCTPLSVNVQAQGQTTGTGTGGQISFYLPMTVGQSLQLGLTGGTGSYYLQSPMSSPALVSVSGNNLMLNGQATGSGVVTVCQTGGTTCLPINISVGPALTGTGGGYFYDTNLSVGSSGQDVLELQNRLVAEGYLSATPTGYFGPLTEAAVTAYQRAHGIVDTGYVGVLTRAELNK